MKRHFRSRILAILALCTLLAHNAIAHAEEPLIPIVEPQTLVLIKMDLNQLNLPQVQKWIANLLSTMKFAPDEQKTAQASILRTIDNLERARGEMVQFGATTVYVSFSMADMKYGPSTYITVDPAVGVPELVTTIMYSGRADGPKAPDPATVAGAGKSVAATLAGGVFYGPLATWQRVQLNKETSPALLKALGEAPAGAAQMAFVNTPQLSQQIEAQLPAIPAPVNLPITTLTHGIKFATVAIQPPPGASAVITIHTSDAATATQLKTIVQQLAPIGAAMFKNNMPGFDSQPTMDAIKLNVVDDKIVLALDEAKLQAVFSAPLTLAVTQARRGVAGALSSSNVHQLVMAVSDFAKQNKGALPDSLDVIKSRLGAAGARIALNPRAVNATLPGYVYVKPAGTIAELPQTTPLIYENPEALPPGTDVIIAGYPDGSVRYVLIKDVLIQP